MNLCRSLQLLRREVGVSKHIPLTHMVNDSMVETKSGDLLAVIALEGAAFHTEQNATLNHLHRVWHRYICSLDDRFGVYVTTHRSLVKHHLEGDFSGDFLQTINRDYMRGFNEKGVYQNRIYLTLIYRGIHSGKIGKGLKILQAITQKYLKNARAEFRQQAISRLSHAVSRALTLLAIFRPTPLAANTQDGNRLLQFFSLLCNLSVVWPMPQKVLAVNPKKQVGEKGKHVLFPESSLASYLPIKQLLFGEIIQVNGLSKSDKRFAVVMSMKGYPEETFSLVLNGLMNLSFEWISTHSFLIESNEVALKKIKQQVARLSNVNDAGISQQTQLKTLPDLIQSHQLRVGFHHHSLLILSETPESLETYIQQAAKCYLSIGFSVVRETLGQEPTFWAQIPGNHRYIARSSLITSENFADLCPLHNNQMGYQDQNHLGSAVTLLETISKTPYFFNFHRPGSRQQLTPGHTIVIGSNGSGKTVLLTFFDAQLSRYQGISVFFDRNRGVEIYIRACGGVYAVLSPDHPKTTCFNPFLLPDTAMNRQFCAKWLAQLCYDEQVKTLAADVHEQIKFCVDYAYDHLSIDQRQLSMVVSHLPVDFPHWFALRRWLRDSDGGNDGEYAYIFDNHSDSLRLADKVGFDMTHFLDHETPQVRTAVLMYLFHWIKQSMNGRLMAIYLDEAWQYFEDDYWREALKRSIPTYRKLNACLIMATQSVNSVINASISHIILDNCATQLLFPNPEARQKSYCDGLSLTDAEFEFIKHNEVNSRLFLIKQDNRSVICTANLSGISEYLPVFSSSETHVRYMDRCIQQYGKDPTDWLTPFLKGIDA